jgi:predicted transcriptional regulator
MADVGRVVTAKLPEELVAELDGVAERIERSKSWIIRHALRDWLAEEQRRYELTVEALEAVENGDTIPHEEVLAMIQNRKQELRKLHKKSAA